MTKQKFDDLAQDYDASRPRYPDALIARVVAALPTGRRLRVLDAGAGTGIALEGLVHHLGEAHDYVAVDVSSGMVELGRQKMGFVDWKVEPVEPALARFDDELDLIVAAQAYQWLDREQFVHGALAALRSGGVLAVLQNNRDHDSSAFLSAYEDLLERRSPGYARDYRAFDIAGELAGPFVAAGGTVTTHAVAWTRPIAVDAFVRMATSSTQVQRAVAAHGPSVLHEVEALAESAAFGGVVDVAYRSEGYLAHKP
ncbi:class I SAM-dependent DNA methyltransferase [Cellulomonas oligotrophica]|uniref:SAM-dependent methyltransferase n=1 Tax=Cellulomonas oligotrophica TaxID=931536 RepID=A0A7Y9FIK8_9CELL|nr:class I SAM-dependent methyltransferase [Cellulomonas oligotrophica]NYD87998.1 SAM-dependent methyltransferase [Cellulomonas oligotrophica]GIG34492.1 hypothetical protein Col01nite_36510 [Cellulomonas oligotrophica]